MKKIPHQQSRRNGARRGRKVAASASADRSECRSYWVPQTADFSRELTTAVLWLNEHDLDIPCVQLKPYVLAEPVLREVSQVIPLPEANEYQARFREKVQRT